VLASLQIRSQFTKAKTMEKIPETTDGRLAAEIAFGPLSQNEGPRIGILGDSGCGKTEAARRLVAEYVRRVPNGVVYCVDDKGTIAQ